MKREALRHPKTYDLASRLDCGRPAALGYLTLLWDYTAEVAIQGDIGKWPDGSIARACEWEGDPHNFVDALIASGWVDRSERYRLVIHDWTDHCERWVKAKAAKLGVSLISSETGTNGTLEPTTERSSETLEPTVEPTAEGTVERSPPRDRTEPNQTKPNLPQPPQSGLQPEEGGGDFSEGWKKAEKKLRDVGLGDPRSAIASAKTNGLEPGQVVSIANFWEANPGSWNLGALHWRIRNASPQDGPEHGWPAPKDNGDGALRAEERERIRREALAAQIVKRGKETGVAEDRIREVLASEGLEWPG
jgi:hypothetical protein